MTEASRAVDVLGALAGLCAAAPLLPLLAVAVKVDSPGPVLYRAERVGLRGRRFHMFKLRTMHVDADRTGPAVTRRADPRCTRVGRVLRALHLDELPQLLNVLRGDMALIGPRPEAPAFVDTTDPRWQRVLSVRPGITGPTQLVHAGVEEDRLGASSAERDYRRDVLPGKLASDVDHVRQGRTVGGDLACLARTLARALGARRRATAR